MHVNLKKKTKREKNIYILLLSTTRSAKVSLLQGICDLIKSQLFKSYKCKFKETTNIFKVKIILFFLLAGQCDY